jgi:hypothetical protein
MIAGADAQRQTQAAQDGALTFKCQFVVSIKSFQCFLPHFTKIALRGLGPILNTRRYRLKHERNIAAQYCRSATVQQVSCYIKKGPPEGSLFQQPRPYVRPQNQSAS